MIRKFIGIAFLALSITPFFLVNSKYVAVSTVASTDIFLEEISATPDIGGLLDNFSGSGTGGNNKKFDIFFKLLSDPYFLGKALYKFKEVCSQTKHQESKYSFHISSERCMNIENIINEFENPTYLVVGSSVSRNLSFTSKRGKIYSEIRISNPYSDNALSLMHGVLFGIDELLKEMSIKYNQLELEAIQNTIDNTLIVNQIPYLSNNYMKSNLALEKSKPSASAQYSHSLLIEPYTRKVSTFFTKVIISFIFLFIGLILIVGFKKSIKLLSSKF